MKRITISLPEDLVSALEREARREHQSVSEIARQAIEARLRPWPIVDGKRVIPFAGIGRSKGDGNIARDMEELMARDWTVENLIDRNR
jgi:Arc/MetJ-type ribon-helix-helix transcriptional regulator